MKTIEVKTSELEGAALDWAVAKAEGDEHWTSDRNIDWFAWRMRNWKPSTDWSQGGPLIDKHDILFGGLTGKPYAVVNKFPNGCGVRQDGATKLIAACRAIVADKLGDMVQVPADLIGAAS